MAASQPSSHGRPSGLSAPRHEQITARSLAPRLRTSRGASCGAGSHGFTPSKDLQQQLPEPRAAGSGGHVNLCHRNASEAAEPRRQSEFRANAVPFRQRTGSIAHASNSYDHETISMSFLRCSTAFAAAAPGDEEIRLVARTAGEGREKKSRPNSARQTWSARCVRQPAERRRSERAVFRHRSTSFESERPMSYQKSMRPNFLDMSPALSVSPALAWALPRGSDNSF